MMTTWQNLFLNFTAAGLCITLFGLSGGGGGGGGGDSGPDKEKSSMCYTKSDATATVNCQAGYLG